MQIVMIIIVIIIFPVVRGGGVGCLSWGLPITETVMFRV